MVKNASRIYSAADLKVLKTLRKRGVTLKVIAKTLGRTPDAIRIKANRLGFYLS